MQELASEISYSKWPRYTGNEPRQMQVGLKKKVVTTKSSFELLREDRRGHCEPVPLSK